jgi:hypothetical protein
MLFVYLLLQFDIVKNISSTAESHSSPGFLLPFPPKKLDTLPPKFSNQLPSSIPICFK